MLPTTKAIQAQFPNPIRGAMTNYPYTDEEYCVGGAICEFFQLAWMNHPGARLFPDSACLAAVLLKKNPYLTESQARISANAIIAANDTGRFDVAWRAADHALSYGAERVPQPTKETMHERRD